MYIYIYIIYVFDGGGGSRVGSRTPSAAQEWAWLQHSHCQGHQGAAADDQVVPQRE